MKGIATEIHHKTEAGLVCSVSRARRGNETFRLLEDRRSKLEAFWSSR